MKTFGEVLAVLNESAHELFREFHSLRSLGIGKNDLGGYEFKGIKNSLIPEFYGGIPDEWMGVPITFEESPSEVVPLPLEIPFSGDEGRNRPLVPGLQIQNYDSDARDGTIEKGRITIGTLGCIVKTKLGEPALLTNGHVIAKGGKGRRGDRVVQPSASTEEEAAKLEIAKLEEFIAILDCTDILVRSNIIDAALAILNKPYIQEYGHQGMPAVTGTAEPSVGDQVFKVGGMTGLTQGTITTTSTIVRLKNAEGNDIWFKDSFMIEGNNESRFSGPGDSGSAIVTEGGKIVGLIYCGNNDYTWACPISEVFRQLGCSLP